MSSRAFAFQQLLGQKVRERFILERELGRDSISVLFRGEDTHKERPVTVRVYAPRKESESKEALDNFRSDIAFVEKNLQHRFLPIIEGGVWEGSPFVVEPFLHHKSIEAKLLDQGTFSVERSLALALALRTYNNNGSGSIMALA